MRRLSGNSIVPRPRHASTPGRKSSTNSTKNVRSNSFEQAVVVHRREMLTTGTAGDTPAVPVLPGGGLSATGVTAS